MSKDTLGDRMKGYENVTRHYLTKRMPIIIRVDGKAFHTLTKGMQRPFDENFTKCMQETAKALCENIQGAKLAYVQSDEISVLLTDYESIDTQAWMDAGLLKMCSISASLATFAFNQEYNIYFPESPKFGLFDSRVFNLPKEEVCNYFIWRQNDAVRNSIQSVGQANFSQKQLHKLNCSQIQEKLFQEKGINWNDTPTHFKRGACVVKKTMYEPVSDTILVPRTQWIVDLEIPTFTQDRNYIENLVYNVKET